MGSDVYLKWKGMNKKNSKDQITGWSIEAGNKGYLRASIGMHNENALMRNLFGNKIWEPEKKDLVTAYYDKKYKCNEEYVPFDFKKHYQEAVAYSVEYILAVANGVDIMHQDAKGQREMGTTIVKMLTGAGFTQDQIRTGGIHGPDSNEIGWAITWANSLLDFMRMGVALQEEGKNPGIYISW